MPHVQLTTRSSGTLPAKNVSGPSRGVTTAAPPVRFSYTTSPGGQPLTTWTGGWRMHAPWRRRISSWSSLVTKRTRMRTGRWSMPRESVLRRRMVSPKNVRLLQSAKRGLDPTVLLLSWLSCPRFCQACPHAPEFSSPSTSNHPLILPRPPFCRDLVLDGRERLHSFPPGRTINPRRDRCRYAGPGRARYRSELRGASATCRWK